MMTDVDVLIIGAGPAGLAAGIVCASQGLHTLICEKRSLPVDKACGEGVMPTGLAHMERLGVKRHVTTGRYFPFDGIRYLSPNGKIASAAFQEGPGWGIPRVELSAALLRRASELECLKIHTGIQANPVRVDTDARHGKVWTMIGNEYVGAQLLIGADGLSSGVRRWAGIEGPSGTHRRWGVRQHFEVPPWSKKVEVYWRDGVEAYVTPCGENLIGVAFLWDQQRHPHLPGGQRLVPTLLEQFPVLARRLKGAPTSHHPLAVGPMQRKATRPTANGVLLIGDAAGYLDAITGEGISLALAQAAALEETVVPLLLKCARSGSLSRSELIEYENAYKSIVQPYYNITGLALWLSSHPKLAEQTIALLARRSDIFQALLSANMGLIPLWQVPLAGFNPTAQNRNRSL